MAKHRQHAKAQGSASRRRTQADSNTYRFFVAPEALQGETAQLDEPSLVHQLNTVLRLQADDQVTLLDNSGWEYAVNLEQVGRDQVVGAVTGKALAATEPQHRVALYVALLRGERFELVLQKATEIGVSVFVPVVCERSIIDDIAEVRRTKTERWERIIREAAEQSRRAKLPTLRPAMLFEAACEDAANSSRAYMLWEGGNAQSLRRLLREQVQQYGQPPSFSTALLSGPEGGFSENELATAASYHIPLASLGPRTLRAETAPIVAAAAVLFEHGDLD